jgi:hypothetical protein
MRNIVPAILLALAACGEPTGAPAALSAARESSTDGPTKSAVISKGKKYAPKDYLVSGYVTILDFYADW